jgi:hypothetical protein
MEWLMSTITMNNSMSERDCVYSRDYFRDQIKKLVEDRKIVIDEFNKDIKMIEENFAAVVAAKSNDQTPIETLCEGVTTQHDVANRKASGKDFLCYMYRRNELFKAYETKMKAWSKNFYDVFKNYENDIKTWGENDKGWMIGGTRRDWKNSRTCRYWVDLWVGVITPKKIKKRWINRYQHKYNSTSEEFKEYISSIDSEAHSKLSKWHWILDPLQPGHGGNDMLKFVKSLKTGSTPENDFILEPELASSFELRGCSTKLEDPKCQPFKQYITDLQQVAKAQSLMYSMHRYSKFKSYYKVEGSPRRRLIDRIITDTTNLQNYYEATIELRVKQNQCIDKVLNQINTAYSGSGAGITEGSANYFEQTTSGDTSVTKDKNITKPKLKSSTLPPMKFSLNSLKSGFKVSETNIDGTQSNGSGSLDSGESSALAARTKALQDANAAARSKGIEVDKIDEKQRSDLRKSNLFSSIGSGNSNLGSLQSSPLNDLKSKTAIGEGGFTDQPKTNLDSIKPVSSFEPSTGTGAASGVGTGYGSSTNPNNNDSTGMSDEEKDRISANYERTKGEYKTKEEDSLFKVLSKTYMRSLDKILKRKKDTDEELPATPKP